MIPLLTAEEMRTLDQHTIDRVGVPGSVLMETAGRGVFQALRDRFSGRIRDGKTAVVCGRGNNGGDGFVVARCLKNHGCLVSAYLLGSRETVGGDAAVHLRAYLGSGGHLVEITEDACEEHAGSIRDATLVVDAVLGTGLVDDVRGLAARAIAWVNQAASPAVSVDIPSGVSSDTGRLCGTAVRADLTVTFAYPKRGHYLYPGASCVGRLETVDIGVPPDALSTLGPGLFCLEHDDVCDRLDRPPDAHKGTLGHVVVFGGTPGKTGAPGLAAWAALRSGAGLATVACPSGLGDARLPLELMTQPLRDGPDWHGSQWDVARESSRQADALVVGPGLGTASGAGAFLRRLLAEEGAPAVLDADALNLLAREPEIRASRRREVVLTPHPGEAARLLGKSTSDVQADRVGAANELARAFGCPVILKGAASLVGDRDSAVFLIPRGNPGMATAGSGDVLSGVVGALLARGLEGRTACCLGGYVHALAGDKAAEQVGVEGLVASDILDGLPAALEELCRLRREDVPGPRGRRKV